MTKKSNTRTAQGAGSIRQRPNGRWEARYTVGHDPGTGKQIRKSIYGSTEKEVLKKLQQVQVDIENGTYTEPMKMTVGMWLDVWLSEYVKDSVKPFTYSNYDTQCRVHIKPALGSVMLQKLSAHSIQAFYNKLYRADKPLSAKSVKNIHGVLHKALGQAVMLDYIKVNPSSICTLPRVIKKEIQPLDENDITDFLKAIDGHKFETIYTVALFTGMRRGEVLGLTWDCIDFNKGTIRINKQLQKERKKGGAHILATLKNDKARLITPAQYIMSLLKNHKVTQLETQLMVGQMWSNENNLIFTNEVGDCLSAQTVYLNYKRIVDKIDIPESRFHDLRHSYAVAALSSGDDVKTVQENLGHHTAAFTLDVYGHVSEKMKKESAARMDVFIKSVQKTG